MVLLLHPWMQAPRGASPDGLIDFVAYAMAKRGVYASSLGEAAERMARAP